MTKNSSDHGDLIVLAIVVSLALHAAMMFFAAPQVMSHVGVSSKEPKRMHRPPMAVKRFEGDPFREHVKTEPKVDVPAPREAPQRLVRRSVVCDRCGGVDTFRAVGRYRNVRYLICAACGRRATG